RPSKIQSADAPPQSVALSPAGDRALVTARDDAKGIYRVYLALFPSLEVRTYALASPPIAAGVVPEPARVSGEQQQPRGWASIAPRDGGDERTITDLEFEAPFLDLFLGK